MSGHSNFNEVFFENVRIPDSQRLGAVGEGWKVALTTLMNERFSIGETPQPDVDQLMDIARNVDTLDGPAIDDPVFEEKLADWYVRDQGLRYRWNRRNSTQHHHADVNPDIASSKGLR